MTLKKNPIARALYLAGDGGVLRDVGAAGWACSLLYSARNSAGVGFRTEPTLYMVLLLWLLNQFALAGVMNVADNSNNEPTACNVFMVYS